MARVEIDPNYSSPTFSRATAATDVFKKEDLQSLAAAVSTHVHDGAGKGLLVGGPAAGSITNAMLGPSVARANQLVNGGFEQWQRGNGPFTANNSLSADRWQQGLSGTDTLSTVRNTANVDVGSNACAACTFVLGSGGGLTQFAQVLKLAGDGSGFAGKTVSLSVRVRTSTANAVRVSVNGDGSGAVPTNSGFHTGGGTYETLTVVYVVPSNATFVQVIVYFAASCTAYLDNANLVVGSQPADYVPMHPADDLARCLRYYEKQGADGSSFLHYTMNASGAGYGNDWTLPFRAIKAAAPTITVVGTWLVSNAGQPTNLGADATGLRLRVVATAGGQFYANNGNAGNNIVAEANP